MMIVKKEKAPRRMTEKSRKQSLADIKSEKKAEKPYRAERKPKGR